MKLWRQKQLIAWVAKHKSYDIPKNFVGNVFDLIALETLNLEQLTDLIFRNEVLELKEVWPFIEVFLPRHSKRDSAIRAIKWSRHSNLRTRTRNTLKSLSFYFQECGLSKESVEHKLKLEICHFLDKHTQFIK